MSILSMKKIYPWNPKRLLRKAPDIFHSNYGLSQFPYHLEVFLGGGVGGWFSAVGKNFFFSFIATE